MEDKLKEKFNRSVRRRSLRKMEGEEKEKYEDRKEKKENGTEGKY